MGRTTDPDFQNFDPQFENLEDYIVKITHEIWEERNINAIRKYYGGKIKLHTPHNSKVGVENVVFSTFQMLHTFPDRQLLPEDVIWGKQPDNSYLSSHRILSVMTHLGDGLYGKPTGKQIKARIIADCAVRDNVIFEEWLVRDRSSILLQMGKSVDAYAHKMAEDEFEENKDPTHFALVESIRSNSSPNHILGKYAQKYGEYLSEIWGQGNLRLIPQLYTPGSRIEAPSNRCLFGHELLNRFYFQYLGIFSDVKFSIENLTEMHEDEKSPRISARWKISAMHSGNGIFGEPTFLPVYILGINHAHVSAGKVSEEWMMFDELSIHRQVHLNRMVQKNRIRPQKQYNTDY